jgi:molecular chaperone GrpE
MTKRKHGEAEDNIANASEEPKTDNNEASAGPEESNAAPKGDKKARKPGNEEQLNAEISELKDRYLRLLAEYDNFRKRTQKERESLYADAVAEIAKEWLPVIDNVERAMCFPIDDSQETAQKVAEGVKMIHRQIQEVFAKFGITEIDCAEGTCFDPNLHEAVLHIEDGELGDQCIAQVFQKGYRTADRVLRYSVVKVAN